jgi:hypothetical protein
VAPSAPRSLPTWLVKWMAEQPETPAELIEVALLARTMQRGAHAG